MDAALTRLLEHARQQEASDLFLSTGRPPYVKYVGRLTEIDHPSVTAGQMADLCRACGVDPDTVRDADRSLAASGGERFRVNIHRREGALGAVLRLVRRQIPTLESLGLPEQLLTRWMSRSSGLVLVTGATGSGKSTTVASCLEWVNQNFERHIVTIEDPVEYLFSDQRSLVTQREVGEDTTSFADGLRGALRQAPDVIFVGEIRDRETASIALQAAETGQVVISTLQSLGVEDTIIRLRNLFPEHDRATALHLLSNELIGILCQQLLPGTDGRLHVILEYMQNEAATRQWIRDEEPERIVELMRDRGGETNARFMDSLVAAARAELISPETGRSACGNETEFNRGLRGIA